MQNSVLSGELAVETAALALLPLQRVLLCAALCVTGWLARCLLCYRVLPFLQRMAEKRSRPGYALLVQAFTHPISLFVFFGVLYPALWLLPWPAAWAAGARHLLLLALRVALIVLLAQGLWKCTPLAGIILNGAGKNIDPATVTTVTGFLGHIVKALIAAFAAVTILNEFGFDVSSLVAGVGLIGLAFSLAAQDTAANLFAGIVIVLEHPMRVGDWVIIGSVEGRVEAVNFRSTKIRALDNTLLTLSNSVVCANTIQNVTRRNKWLYRFTLGVTYDTKRATLEKLMADLRAMLESHSEVYADNIEVRLVGFGDSSIDILVHCYVKARKMDRFLEIQNMLNLCLMDVMEQNGCSFAFPSTSVYMENRGEK